MRETEVKSEIPGRRIGQGQMQNPVSPTRFAILVLAASAIAPVVLHADNSCLEERTAAEKRLPFLPEMSSPFVMRVIGPIQPVKGTDGLIHLSYAVQVTNTTVNRGTNFKAVAVDPVKEFEPTGHNFVETDEGKDITGLIRRFAVKPTPGGDGAIEPVGSEEAERQQYRDALGPGGSGVMFFDVTYDDPVDVPSFLSHKLFVDVPSHGLNEHTAFTKPIPVDCKEPMVLKPPLAGSGWFDVNGCCAIINGHRSAVLALNGDLWSPEQFAVDWIQIDSNGTCCNGDPHELSSWKTYGAPIHASAAGTVARIVGPNLPDQKPITPPVGVTLDNVTGNAIIQDIGGGRFILYAHLVPGSIPANIHEGSWIEAGQVIGKLGNSGNSSAPHLHFQVMDSASPLASTGMPFVFDRLNVQGHIIGIEGFVVDDFLAGKPISLDNSGNGHQSERMPISSTVYEFE
jgi:hypothetical protein